MRLSDRRAAAVADVARSVGAMVEREIGFGETPAHRFEQHCRRYAAEPSCRNRLLQVVTDMTQRFIPAAALMSALMLSGCIEGVCSTIPKARTL